MFNVGDKVKIPYISDCNPHNNKVGTVTWLREYNHYPNGDYSVIEKRTQGTITYDDGTTESIGHFYRKGGGLVSPIVKVDNSEFNQENGGKNMEKIKFLWSVNEVCNGVIFAESEEQARNVLNKNYKSYDFVEAEGHTLCRCGKILKNGSTHNCYEE